jgi:hypothetical protein
VPGWHGAIDRLALRRPNPVVPAVMSPAAFRIFKRLLVAQLNVLFGFVHTEPFLLVVGCIKSSSEIISQAKYVQPSPHCGMNRSAGVLVITVPDGGDSAGRRGVRLAHGCDHGGPPLGRVSVFGRELLRFSLFSALEPFLLG